MLATLDDPDAVAPTHAFGKESKRAWSDGLHNLPMASADDELPPAMKEKLVNQQHPDRA